MRVAKRCTEKGVEEGKGCKEGDAIGKVATIVHVHVGFNGTFSLKYDGIDDEDRRFFEELSRGFSAKNESSPEKGMIFE